MLPLVRWIALQFLLVLPTVVGSGEVLAQAASSLLPYGPVIVIGQADAKRRLTFMWGADEASRKMFQTYIRPIIARAARKDAAIAVTLVQRPTKEEGDTRGPGTLLFCARNAQQYALMAYEYLIFPFDVGEKVPLDARMNPSFLVNDNIRKVLGANNIDVGACIRSEPFMARLARYFATDVTTELAVKEAELPSAFWEGRAITVRDRRGLAMLEKLAKVQ